MFAVMCLPALTWANYVQMDEKEREGTITIYKPYTEVHKDEALIEEMATTGTAMLMRKINELKEKGKITDGMFSDENAETLLVDRIKLHEALKKLIGEVNEVYDTRRDQIGGEFTKRDLLPKAYLVTAGGKTSGKTKASMAKRFKYFSLGSFNFAVIFVPTLATTIDTQTGKTINEEVEILASFVLWPLLDAFDLDVVKESKRSLRLGAGVIWDVKDRMVKPSDFAGVSNGVSITGPGMENYITRFSGWFRSLPLLQGIFKMIGGIASGSPITGTPKNDVNYKIGVLHSVANIQNKNKSWSLKNVKPDYVYLTISKSLNSMGSGAPTLGLKVNPFGVVFSMETFISSGFKVLDSLLKSGEKSLVKDLKKSAGADTKTSKKKPTSAGTGTKTRKKKPASVE